MTQRDDEATLTIGDLARQCGVSVGTIRAWEQRYDLLSPSRSPGGHRRYGMEDLRRINAVRILVSQGATLPAAAARVKTSKRRPRGGPLLPTAGLDPLALEAAYRATRSLLHITRPAEAVDVLVALVEELGGDVVAADLAGPDAIPLDLSLGEVDPLLPVADPLSIARLQLERVLPPVVDDARRAAALARRRSLSPSAWDFPSSPRGPRQG